MAGLFATLVVGVVVAVLAIFIISTKLNERRKRHRRDMQDLVRGRTGRTTSASPGQQHFDGMAPVPAALPSGPPAQPSGLESELQAIRRLGQKGRSRQGEEDAILARAQRLYEQTLAEARAENPVGQARKPGDCTLQISYVDADGVYTTRNVVPYKSGNTNEKFDAWCETRRDRRTFFFSRVQGGVDLTTGMRLDRAGVFRRIHPQRRVPFDLQ